MTCTEGKIYPLPDTCGERLFSREGRRKRRAQIYRSKQDNSPTHLHPPRPVFKSYLKCLKCVERLSEPAWSAWQAACSPLAEFHWLSCPRQAQWSENKLANIFQVLVKPRSRSEPGVSNPPSIPTESSRVPNMSKRDLGNLPMFPTHQREI